jgi:uncharacterized protein YacL
LGAYIGNVFGKDPIYSGSLGMATGFALVLLEMAFARRFITIISIVMFGVVFGFIIAHFLIHALYLIPTIGELGREEKRYLEFSLTFLFSFISVIAIIHTKDDFKFVIPFIELSKERRIGRPIILDTSTIIDGRILDIYDSRVIDSPLIIPRFVLEELQTIADSADRSKRLRGRRGLDLLNKLKKRKGIDLSIHETASLRGEGVDAQLIRLARNLDARIMTTDFNLNKVAQVQGVEVINVNDLANALRPVFHHGDELTVKIVRPGEEPGQGVGYLEDGTMVVAEDCADRLGEWVDLSVVNILQTTAGRMIFGRPKEGGLPR